MSGYTFLSHKKTLLAATTLIASLWLTTACDGSERLRLGGGRTTVKVEQLPAEGTHEYSLRASTGEVLALRVVSPGNDVYLAVEGADGRVLAHAASKLEEWTGVIPATQDYVITVSGGRRDSEYVLAVTKLPELNHSPSHRFVGVYHMTAPQANALHDLVLILDDDGAALLTGLAGVDSLALVAMKGSWQAEGDVATVKLTGQNGEEFGSPEIIKIEWRDGILAVNGHDTNAISSWRTVGIRFTLEKGDYNRIVWNVLNHVQPGDIVLMHDGGGERSQTILALEVILRELSARGYRFKSLFD